MWGKEVGEAQGVPNVRRDDRVSAVADSKPQALRSRRVFRIAGIESESGAQRGMREISGVSARRAKSERSPCARTDNW